MTLAVSLIEQQLEKFSSHLQLVGGVMHFLGQLASTVKACATASPEGEPVTYSPEQVSTPARTPSSNISKSSAIQYILVSAHVAFATTVQL